MKTLRLCYGFSTIFGVCISMYWSYGLIVQIHHNRPIEILLQIIIVDIILIGLSLISGVFEFLLIFRFIEEFKKDGDMYSLMSPAGRLVAVAESIEIVKRVAHSFESSGEDRYQVFIFSAAGKYWVSKNVPS